MIVALLKDQIKKATDSGKYDLVSQLAGRIKTIEQVGSLKTQIKAATDEGQYDMIPGLARQTQKVSDGRARMSDKRPIRHGNAVRHP